MRCLDAVAAERAALGAPVGGAGARQRLRRRLGGGRAGARRGRIELVALEQRRRQGVRRQRADAPRARALLPAAQRGLGAPAGREPRRWSRRSTPTRARPARSPRCGARTARRSRLRVALPDRRGRAGGGAAARARWSPCRAAAPRRAGSTGASRRRCSCGARPPRRSTGWTRRSSSTPTRSTSRSGSPLAGWHSLYVPAARAIHHEQLATGRAAAAARSSSSRADATATCASTTAPLAAAAVRWLTAWTYGLRALAAIGPARPRPGAATAHTPRRRCARGAARGWRRPRPRYNAARRRGAA